MRRPPRIWVRAPKGPIPQPVQEALRTRLEEHARRKWKRHCGAVVVRFRGAFAYVDAFRQERPSRRRGKLAERARMEGFPTHLCRLGYLGSADRWEYFFKYSDLKYERSVVASGSFEATPDEAFDCSALVYLADGVI